MTSPATVVGVKSLETQAIRGSGGTGGGFDGIQGSDAQRPVSKPLGFQRQQERGWSNQEQPAGGGSTDDGRGVGGLGFSQGEAPPPSGWERGGGGPADSAGAAAAVADAGSGGGLGGPSDVPPQNAWERGRPQPQVPNERQQMQQQQQRQMPGGGQHGPAGSAGGSSEWGLPHGDPQQQQAGAVVDAVQAANRSHLQVRFSWRLIVCVVLNEVDSAAHLRVMKRWIL